MAVAAGLATLVARRGWERERPAPAWLLLPRRQVSRRAANRLPPQSSSPSAQCSIRLRNRTKDAIAATATRTASTSAAVPMAPLRCR